MTRAGRDLARTTGVVTALGAAVMLAASGVFATLALRVHTPGWSPTRGVLHWAMAPAGVTKDTRGNPVLDLGPQQPTLALVRGPGRSLGVRLGGRTVPPDVLVAGREQYVRYCAQCHGDRGDGRGISATGLVPPPRDFTTGRFKFAAVPSGALPADADLVRVVRRGLAGTAMRAWDVPGGDLDAIVQYLKTLSPRWQREGVGAPVVPDTGARRDPWTPAQRTEAVSRGARVYHGLALCFTCHPAYVPQAEVSAAIRALTGTVVTAFRDDLHAGVRKHEDGYGTDVLAPDFTRVPPRAGATVADVYRTLSAGVGATPMPGWRDGLPEADVWALAYYVADLAAMRDTPAAVALHDALDAADGTGSAAGATPGATPGAMPGR